MPPVSRMSLRPTSLHPLPFLAAKLAVMEPWYDANISYVCRIFAGCIKSIGWVSSIRSVRYSEEKQEVIYRGPFEFTDMPGPPPSRWLSFISLSASAMKRRKLLNR